MRLIDADKLVRTTGYYELRNGKTIELHYVDVGQIDNAPTVDAMTEEEAIPKDYIWQCIRRADDWCFDKDTLIDLIRAWEEQPVV